MRSYLSGFVLTLLASVALVFPARADTVNAKGVGMAPMTAGASATRRVSLQLAKRDAVERGLGARVSVESIPASDLVRVVATSSASLSYEVVSEGEADGYYVTEILAEVEIPAELASRYPPGPEEDTGYKPLVQTFPHGEIDWEAGYITARGGAKLPGEDAKSVAEARRAARVDAYSVALEAIAGVPFDPEERVSDRIRKTPELEFKISGLVRGGEVIEERRLGGRYEVEVKIPLRGIKGVQSAFTESLNFREEGAVPARSPGEDDYTGVLVDARGAGLAPAFFPEIVDEDGEEVYSGAIVDPKSLTFRGAAAYVVEEKDKEGGGEKGAFLPGRWLVVKAVSLAPSAVGAGFSSEVIDYLKSPLVAQAARPRVVIRQGPRPVPVKATKSAGPTRSRVVISNQSAKQIRTANRSTGFLTSARVVVITDSMIGGTEGRRENTEPRMASVR